MRKQPLLLFLRKDTQKRGKLIEIGPSLVGEMAKQANVLGCRLNDDTKIVVKGTKDGKKHYSSVPN